jgi:hypothetical protein
MSLITSASPWTSSSSSSSTTSKRTSSIGKRRTQKAVRDNVDYSTDSIDIADVEDTDLSLSEPMQSTIAMNEERGKTVNDMLNRITASHSGDDLVDFKPVDTNLAKQRNKESFESPMLKRAAGLPEYTPSDLGTDHLSNYTKSYEAGAILGKPYYNKGSSSSDGSSDTALMQKLNYITHILEDIQLEKTSNITEELILYSFLGVFVIFIVDSFARVGKYHR